MKVRVKLTRPTIILNLYNGYEEQELQAEIEDEMSGNISYTAEILTGPYKGKVITGIHGNEGYMC